MTQEEYISSLEHEVEELRREVQLNKLRRQVTPHFLFNSISVAVSLVLQSPGTAVTFLRHLAQMYRYLLNYGNELHVPIEQEMEMLSKYYELMSLRHVDCLSLEITPEARKLRKCPMPPLALQGLLENAIKHNVHTVDNPLHVTIDTDGEYLTVSNRLMPLLSDTRSTKTGLAHMSQTMQLLFNKDIVIENDGETFTVRIPLVGKQTCGTTPVNR